MKKGYKVVTLSVSVQVARALERVARRTRLSRSKIVEVVICLYLEREKSRG